MNTNIINMRNKRYEKYKETYKKYNEKNKERVNEITRNWRSKNKERIKEVCSNWKSKNRFGGLRNFIIERDNWSCIQCGTNQEQHLVIFGRSLTVDHIDGKGRKCKKPNNNPENLQTLCLRCHGKKDILRREWRPIV